MTARAEFQLAVLRAVTPDRDPLIPPDQYDKIIAAADAYVAATLRELAAELDERAASYRRSPDATEQMARHARAAIQAAAEMARQQARGHAQETDGHSLASVPGQDGRSAPAASQPRGWDER